MQWHRGSTVGTYLNESYEYEILDSETEKRMRNIGETRLAFTSERGDTTMQ